MDAVTNTTAKSTHAVELTTALSSRYALTWQQFTVCAAFSILFVLLSYLPLFHAITWRHVQMGDWIVTHATLPAVDPGLPLSDGFRSVPTAWLSDVLLSVVYHQAGLQGLSSTLAVMFVGLMALTCGVFYAQSQRIELALAATAVVLAVHWPRISILRPEWFGLIGFMLLLALLSRVERESATPRLRWWAATVLLMTTWANLDGSVVLGVIVLAGWSIAQVIPSLLENRSLVRTFADPRVTRSVYLAELAWGASLCQPLGLNLWIDFVSNSRASVWWALGGYSPLVLASPEGLALLGLAALAAGLLRFSPRSVSAADVTLVALAAAAVIVNRGMTLWSVPLLVFVLLPHLASVLHERGWLIAMPPRPVFAEGEAPPPLAFAFSMLSLLVIWCAFVLSPLANPVFGGRPRPEGRIVSNQAPVAVSRFLNELPAGPSGLVWVPEEWGDWLSLTGPKGLQVSANSQIHLLPDRQKFDIVQVSRADGNWTKTLDRYGVEWLVIDKEHQPRLFDAALASGENWTIGYEDARSLVLRRRT